MYIQKNDPQTVTGLVNGLRTDVTHTKMQLGMGIPMAPQMVWQGTPAPMIPDCVALLQDFADTGTSSVSKTLTLNPNNLTGYSEPRPYAVQLDCSRTLTFVLNRPLIAGENLTTTYTGYDDRGVYVIATKTFVANEAVQVFIGMKAVSIVTSVSVSLTRSASSDPLRLSVGTSNFVGCPVFVKRAAQIGVTTIGDNAGIGANLSGMSANVNIANLTNTASGLVGVVVTGTDISGGVASQSSNVVLKAGTANPTTISIDLEGESSISGLMGVPPVIIPANITTDAAFGSFVLGNNFHPLNWLYVDMGGSRGLTGYSIESIPTAQSSDARGLLCISAINPADGTPVITGAISDFVATTMTFSMDIYCYGADSYLNQQLVNEAPNFEARMLAAAIAQGGNSATVPIFGGTTYSTKTFGSNLQWGGITHLSSFDETGMQYPGDVGSKNENYPTHF